MSRFNRFLHILASSYASLAAGVVYTLVIAFLMISKLPVYSGKKIGTRVPPDMVLPVFVLVVLFFALLISFPWEVMTTGTLLYLASLPFGFWSYRRYARAEATAQRGEEDRPATPRELPAPEAPQRGTETNEERPRRLN